MPISLLLVMLIVVSAGVGGAVLGIRALRRRGGVTEPACGRCGYAVRGLTTFGCPECGSDLREVGIRTAALSGVSSFALLAAAWVIVFLTVGAVGLPLVGSVTPYAATSYQRRVIFIQAPYLHATVTAESEWLTRGGFGSPVAPPASAPVRLKVDRKPPLTASTSIVVAPGGSTAQVAPAGLVLTQPATASEPAILKWLQQRGYSVTDPRAADRVHDLAQCIDEMRQSMSTSFTHLTEVTAHPTFQYTRRGDALWFRIVYGLLWLMIFIAGLAWLRRRTGASARAVIAVPVVIALVLAVGVFILGVS